MTLRVASGDIDGQSHVNNVVYLRWPQDVAVAHWEALAPDEDQVTTGWVVLRHEIDYKGAGEARRSDHGPHMGRQRGGPFI